MATRLNAKWISIVICFFKAPERSLPLSPPLSTCLLSLPREMRSFTH